MIPISALKELYTALPNSCISEPVHQNKETGNEQATRISFILDRNQNRIGCIDWTEGSITIYKEYEYADEVIDSIGKEMFTKQTSHYDVETDLPKDEARADRKQKELEKFMEENEQATKTLYK